MGVSILGLGVLLLACFGVSILLIGGAVFIYFYRRKKPPRGFDVEPAKGGQMVTDVRSKDERA